MMNNGRLLHSLSQLCQQSRDCYLYEISSRPQAIKIINTFEQIAVFHSSV